jgi:hypothetical protein
MGYERSHNMYFYLFYEDYGQRNQIWLHEYTNTSLPLPLRCTINLPPYRGWPQLILLLAPPKPDRSHDTSLTSVAHWSSGLEFGRRVGNPLDGELRMPAKPKWYA